jgi:hypothetical protein
MPYEFVWIACTEVLVILPGYIAGSLSRSEMLLIADHLEACISCEEALARLMVSLGAASPAAPAKRTR